VARTAAKDAAGEAGENAADGTDDDGAGRPAGIPRQQSAGHTADGRGGTDGAGGTDEQAGPVGADDDEGARR
jgi:hypothetical protein